jgi:hypothetical protein
MNHRQKSGDPKGSLSLRLPGSSGDGFPISAGGWAKSLADGNLLKTLGLELPVAGPDKFSAC